MTQNWIMMKFLGFLSMYMLA